MNRSIFKSSLLEALKGDEDHCDVVHCLLCYRSLKDSVNAFSALFVDISSFVFEYSFPNTREDFCSCAFVKDTVTGKEDEVHVAVDLK